VKARTLKRRSASKATSTEATTPSEAAPSEAAPSEAAPSEAAPSEASSPTPMSPAKAAAIEVAAATTEAGTTEAGTTRAANSAARIVSTAARWIYEGRRLDMQGLADELGVSRVTLFRRVGSREELISQALWRLTERMLEIAVERWEAERPEGELHTPGTIRHINAMVAGSTGLRRMLDDEPALTMRVLTDPRGRVQSGIVAFNEVLLRQDMEEFGLVTITEPSALAYALVRLGESFLYADVIAARKPDVETANRLQQAIIEGILP
jgi:AcrR family transcriptional regulator